MVLKHERGNRLAKEALEKFKKSKRIERELKGRFKKDPTSVDKTGSASRFLIKGGYRSDRASNDGSGDEEDSLRGSVSNTVIPGMGTAGQAAVEIRGISGALILIFRVFCDVLGGVFGTGVLSPAYYKYF